MELQKFLMEHKDDWEEILDREPYCLKWNKWKGFVSFKYNQIQSDFSNPIVREARGAVFFEDTWECVSRAFDKFFNYGEPNASAIDWGTARVMEKIDGSLMRLFYWEGKWYLVTNSGIDAYTAPTGDINYPTFGRIFEEGLRSLGYKSLKDFCNKLNRYRTYMFELVSPYTRVVIPYESIGIYYLGERRMIDYQEFYSPSVFPEFCHPKLYNCSNLFDLIKMAQELPWDKEGYVVCDKNFNRIKVKSPQYILAHYARNNNVITEERLMEVILKGETEEFSCYASEYLPKLQELQKKKATLQAEAELLRSLLQSQFHFASRKEFASTVNKISNPAIRQFCFSNKSWEDMTKDWSAKKWVEKLK